MASPNFNTYDGSVSLGLSPYRPGVSDVGGCQKLDDQAFPPDPGTMATAADFNQLGLLAVAYGKVTPAALFLVTNAGVASISALRAAGSLVTATPVSIVGTGSTSGDFTVTRFAAGDVEIRCPASKLMQPLGAFAASQAAGDYRVSARVNATNDGIRVETRDGAGALADVNFLAIWF